MGRKTNKAQVLELAARLGVDVEYGQLGSEGFEVALYGYGAHMAFDPMGEGHTAITNQSGNVGTAISAATPAETMRAMIGQSFGVSRETVRLWETDNYREYGFDTRPCGPRGIARFTDPAPNPYK